MEERVAGISRDRSAVRVGAGFRGIEPGESDAPVAAITGTRFLGEPERGRIGA